MKTREGGDAVNTRWVDRPLGADGPEDRAAALLRQNPEPPLLSAQALGRIWEEVATPAGQKKSWLRAPLFLTLSSAGAVAVVVLLAFSGPAQLGRWFKPGQPRGAVQTVIALTSCGQTQKLDVGAAEMTFVGPASATVSGAVPGAVTLQSGRLNVQAGKTAAQVDLGGAMQVTARPGARVEIEAQRDGVVGQWTIAAFAGSAEVTWRHVGEVVTIPAGTEVRLDAEGHRESAVASPRPMCTTPGPVSHAEAAVPVVPSHRVPASAAAPVAAVAAPEAVEAPATPERERKQTPAVEEPLAPREKRRPRAEPAPASPRPLPPPAMSPLPASALLPPASPGPAADSAITVAPAPSTPTPPAQSAPPAPRADSALALESQSLGRALKLLRQDRDGARALEQLDEYQGKFPRGVLRPEAEIARIDALLLLKRHDRALSLLDAMTLADRLRGRDLRVLRGELRAKVSRCKEAVSDFAGALTGASDGLEERALYGRATCATGDEGRADLQAYRARFPNGRFAPAVRRALGKSAAPQK